MSVDSVQCAVDKVARLCAAPRGLVSLWRDASDVVAGVVPYYWTPCWFTLDPVSLLMTSHYHFGMDEFPGEWLAAEYYEDDVQSVPDVMRSADGVSTLHEAAHGDPSGSPRWRRNRTLGGDQELIARLRTHVGSAERLRRSHTLPLAWRAWEMDVCHGYPHHRAVVWV